MIAILIPCLARPANAAKVAASIHAATTVPHRVVFIAYMLDREQIAACRATDATVIETTWKPGVGDYARKIQLGYDLSDEPFVFQAADDLDFKPGWDAAALELIEHVQAGVCGTNDLHNPSVLKGTHSTHSLIRRDYIERRGGTFEETPGVVLSDAYDHQCVDVELVAVATAHGKYAHCHDSHVEHLHPLWHRRIPRDKTYERALAQGQEDIALYRRRLAAWQARVAA